MSESTAVATRNTFSAFMAQDAIKRKVGEIVGGKKGDGFVTSIVACVSNNPALAGCANDTILSAALQGAALDLSPSPALGHFYMVPFEDRKNNRTVATFQIGYKGYIQLAIRSGQYRRINVIALKEGELVSYNRLTEEIFTKLIDDDEIRDKTDTTGYYAMFELTNGFIKTMYWSKAKMEQHANKYSQAFSLAIFHKIVSGEIPQGDLWKREYSSFWYKDFDGMAFKTMLRQLLSKWGVMSIEMQKAFEADMGLIEPDGKPSYIDNEDPGAGSGEQKKQEPAVAQKKKDAWTDEDFKRAVQNWLKLIADKKKTPEDAISAMSTKGTLTEAQIAVIRNTSAQGVASSAQASNGATAGAAAASITFAQVESNMLKAKDMDILDVAADLIGEVSDPQQRAELSAIYTKRKEELQA